MPSTNDSKRDEMLTDIATIKAEVHAMKTLVATLVTRVEFTPVKLIVYGLVGSILAGVVGALLSLVLIK
jgi:hypothetical protein